MIIGIIYQTLILGYPSIKIKYLINIRAYMTIINCFKLKKESEALDYQPYPGDIGIKIMENISAEAWKMWMTHQTMLINEMRLTPVDPKSRKFLEEEMEKFLFGDGSDAPEGFVPEKK
jgi:Fe-S cluster biosynthesis and repair protein YggX